MGSQTVGNHRANWSCTKIWCRCRLPAPHMHRTMYYSTTTTANASLASPPWSPSNPELQLPHDPAWSALQNYPQISPPLSPSPPLRRAARAAVHRIPSLSRVAHSPSLSWLCFPPPLSLFQQGIKKAVVYQKRINRATPLEECTQESRPSESERRERRQGLQLPLLLFFSSSLDPLTHWDAILSERHRLLCSCCLLPRQGVVVSGAEREREKEG
jgi:hypothetical protein